MSVELFRGKWRFRVVVKLPDGTKRRISGTPQVNTKGAAKAMERQEIEKLLNPNYVAPVIVKKLAPTFLEFAKVFMEQGTANNKTSEQINKESVLRTNLVPWFGAVRLDEIDYAAIQDYVAVKLKELAAKTVKNHLAVLMRILRVAKKRGLISSIPEVESIKVPEAAFDYLSFDEADALLRCCDDGWRVFFLVAIRTGLREGELIALDWKDVDLEKGVIRVRRNWTKKQMQSPKSGKERDVPLGAEVHAALRRYRDQGGVGLVFHRDGTMLTPDTIKYWLRKFLKAAGIRTTLKVHDLRHTFASHLVMRGVSLYKVQMLCGHADSKTTQRYAHLSPQVEREAVAVLDHPNGIQMVSGEVAAATA